MSVINGKGPYERTTLLGQAMDLRESPGWREARDSIEMRQRIGQSRLVALLLSVTAVGLAALLAAAGLVVLLLGAL